jgi:ribosomal protein L29
MKSKDRKELHLKSLEDLKKLAMDAKDALSDLALDKAQNKLKNTSQLSVKRKEIAQMLTLVREKELQEEMEAKNEKTNK